MPPLTRAAWPWTRTRAPGGLTLPRTSMLAPWTTAVSTGVEISSRTGCLGLGRRVVAAAAGEGAGAACRDEGSEPHVDQPG